MMLESRFNLHLERRKKAGNWRFLPKNTPGIDFASNDYLGLARSGLLVEQYKELKITNFGSTGSRLLTGNSTFIEQLEKDIASFHQAESGLIFNSGYTANLGLISAIASKDDCCFYDSHVHASTHDGMHLSQSRRIPWRHNDLEHLEQRLKNTPINGTAFVLIESVYSCDGSIASLEKLCNLCTAYGAKLIVDEAHANGILGIQGRGLVSELNCAASIFARIYTFSKALGCFGAIVLGSSLLKDYLINFCRPFIYATALPMPILIGIKSAYEQILHADLLRNTLTQLIKYFKCKVMDLELPFLDSTTPIQSLIIPGNLRVRSLRDKLLAFNFDVRALTSPTVNIGKECLRLCLHAFNTKEEVDSLLLVLSEQYHQQGASTHV